MTNPPEGGDQERAGQPVGGERAQDGVQEHGQQYGPPSGQQYGQPTWAQPDQGQQPHAPGQWAPQGYWQPAEGWGQQYPQGAQYGQQYGQPGYGYGQPPYGQHPYAQPPYGQHPYAQPQYAPGGYGTPPPKKKRTGLIAGLIGALAVVVAVVVVLSLTLGGRVLDRAAVQRDVAQQFQQHEGVAIQLRCDRNMKLVQGATYACEGTTADGENLTLQIRITDAAAAAYTWSVQG
jgi:hypothetical protein